MTSKLVLEALERCTNYCSWSFRLKCARLTLTFQEVWYLLMVFTTYRFWPRRHSLRQVTGYICAILPLEVITINIEAVFLKVNTHLICKFHICINFEKNIIELYIFSTILYTIVVYVVLFCSYYLKLTCDFLSYRYCCYFSFIFGNQCVL